MTSIYFNYFILLAWTITAITRADIKISTSIGAYFEILNKGEGVDKLILPCRISGTAGESKGYLWGLIDTRSEATVVHIRNITKGLVQPTDMTMVAANDTKMSVIEP